MGEHSNNTFSSGIEETRSILATALQNQPNVLVVCTGNICRSPMGEVVLGEKLASSPNQLLSRVQVSSAAVSREEEGNPIYPPAARTLHAHGYPVPQRHAHQASAHELREAGIILALTAGHARSLARMCESAGVSSEKIHLWREFDGSGLTPSRYGVFGEDGALAGEQHSSHKLKRSSFQSINFYSFDGAWDVPDPWYTGDYEETFCTIEAGADGFIEYFSY